jgi:hypothetical protein
MTAGADLDRVVFVSGPGGRLLALPEHLPLLARAVAETRAVFVFIDPLVAHISQGINSWKDQDVRRVTAPLAEMAEHHQITPVGVIHLNRRDSEDVLTRIGGSGGWGAAARSVLVVSADPDDGQYSLVAQAKLNVGLKHPSLRFRFEGRTIDTPDGPTETAALVWAGESTRRADELLRPISAEDRSAIEEAKAFLLQALATDERESKKVYREARETGIQDRTLERAKAALGVRSVRRASPGTRGGGMWFWTLPGKSAIKGATPPLYGDLGDVGDLDQTRVIPGEETHLDIKIARGIRIETGAPGGNP